MYTVHALLRDIFKTSACIQHLYECSCVESSFWMLRTSSPRLPVCHLMCCCIPWAWPCG